MLAQASEQASEHAREPVTAWQPFLHMATAGGGNASAALPGPPKLQPAVRQRGGTHLSAPALPVRLSMSMPMVIREGKAWGLISRSGLHMGRGRLRWFMDGCWRTAVSEHRAAEDAVWPPVPPIHRRGSCAQPKTGSTHGIIIRSMSRRLTGCLSTRRMACPRPQRGGIAHPSARAATRTCRLHRRGGMRVIDDEQHRGISPSADQRRQHRAPQPVLCTPALHCTHQSWGCG